MKLSALNGGAFLKLFLLHQAMVQAAPPATPQIPSQTAANQAQSYDVLPPAVQPTFEGRIGE